MTNASLLGSHSHSHSLMAVGVQSKQTSEREGSGVPQRLFYVKKEKGKKVGWFGCMLRRPPPTPPTLYMASHSLLLVIC